MAFLVMSMYVMFDFSVNWSFMMNLNRSIEFCQFTALSLLRLTLILLFAIFIGLSLSVVITILLPVVVLSAIVTLVSSGIGLSVRKFDRVVPSSIN